MLHLGPAVTRRLLTQVGMGIAIAAVCAINRCGIGVLAAPRAGTLSSPAVTFNRDVAPVVYRSCSSCHRPGEAAPFSLLTYADVKSHARQIAAITHSRIMPPWLPDPQEWVFADELRLSEDEISLFQKWVDQGEVEGTPSDLPPPPKFVEGWQLGKPDLVLTAQKPFQLPAGGTDTYWNFIFRLPIEGTRWARAVEIRPGDKRYVHHANILVDRTHSARRREQEPGAGFAGMEIRLESESFEPDSHFLFWKPGTVPSNEPDGMALRLDNNTDLVLNVHLQPSGKPESIQPSLGIYFTDKPATLYPMLLQLEADAQLDIPAGQQNFLVTDDFTLPVDVSLLGVYPHAHYLGKDMVALAKLPDGTTKTLIHIPRWDLNWQAVYRYAVPVPLPEGTKISMRYSYDNSEGNPSNPSHPPHRVTAGNRSVDEMAHLWLQVLPKTSGASGRDPRMVLQEALARHDVDKRPGDFEALYNLAAMLQAGGQFEEAIAQYELALGIRPDDPTAHNAMGGALLATGHPQEAVRHFQAALKARPDYFAAHYNLGIALAEQGDFAAAADQLRAAVDLNPQDADAHANLGSALAELGRKADAKAQFEQALRINSAHAMARENLEQLLRTWAER
jgi:Flp pilus assembly protein TadD